MLKNIFCVCCLVFGIVSQVAGQSFGGNKWSQQWQQYKSDDIRVIFPVGYDTEAARVFSIVNYLHANHRNTIGLQTDKISIVLNNLTNVSNGYVGLAPFRSEFFATPPQNSFLLGSLPWMDLLAVHEYRHVLQFSNGRRGISKLASVLFGQFAFAGAINVAVPDWYFEGDAVLAETSMTPQGRGRIPQFLQAYKAYEKSGIRFSYDKVRNGSFRHFIPDHYRLGYMMSKYGADQYGSSFWGEVLQEAGAYKGLFYPFSNAMKRRSGHTTKTMYTVAFDQFKSDWTNEQIKYTSAESLFENKDRFYTNYRLPQYQNGELYFMKGSLTNINEVWKYDGSKKSKLFTYGTSNDIYFDINGGKISWAEYRWHPSRGNINYSVIMTYDLDTGEKKQISNGTRYTSPTHHPTENILATVETDALGRTQIKIISNRDALVVDSLLNNKGYFITYPKWNKDGNAIYFSARDQSGKMAICKQDLKSADIETISQWTYHPIGIPYIHEDHIYYSRSADDAEHIYRIPLEGGTEQLVIESEFGAYQPTVTANEVIYSSYTADGYKLVKSTIAPQPSTTLSEKSNTDPTYLSYGGNILDKIDPVPAKQQKYGRLSHPINLHSWGLAADDQTASLLIQSDNILNTISLSGGLQYIIDDERAIWTARAKLGFFYPNLTIGYTAESRSFIDQDDGTEVKFDDESIELGLEFPMNLSSGSYLRSMLPRYTVKRNSFYIKNRLDKYQDFTFTSHEFGLQLLNRRLKAHSEVLAKYSQYFSFNYQGVVDNAEGNQFDLESEFTFPGLMATHAFRFELDYNSQSNNLFGNRFDGARGYTSIRGDRSFRLGINYHLPLLYPDFGIAGIMYFKRVQANLFYDFSRISLESSLDLSSTGIEILFDTEVLNTLPVTFGVRYANQLLDNRNVVEFFVPFYRF